MLTIVNEQIYSIEMFSEIFLIDHMYRVHPINVMKIFDFLSMDITPIQYKID